MAWRQNRSPEAAVMQNSTFSLVDPTSHTHTRVYTYVNIHNKITLLRVIPTVTFMQFSQYFMSEDANTHRSKASSTFCFLYGVFRETATSMVHLISPWHSIWHSIWHIFWHSSLKSTWNILAFYLAYILAFYLAHILTVYLAFYLAYYLVYILTWYLAYILTFYLAFCLTFLFGILSDILCWHSIWHSILAFYCDILAWHSIWHIFWHSTWHLVWQSIWHISWHSSWHSIWHSIRHSIWHSIWHSI